MCQAQERLLRVNVPDVAQDGHSGGLRDLGGHFREGEVSDEEETI
jgi:hypothetical protein